MGLFSDLFGSSSHTSTTQTTNQVSNTQLAGGNVAAPVVYGTGNTQTIVSNTVDPGAIALAGYSSGLSQQTAQLGLASGADTAARGIQAGVATAYDISQAAIQLGANSNSLAGAVTNNALNFGTSALGAATASTDAISRFSQSALQTNANLASSALTGNAGLANTAIGAVVSGAGSALNFGQTVLTDSLQGQQNLVGQSIGAISGLASQVSQSATQSVNDSLTKMVTIIAVAAAAAFILKGAR